MHAVASSRGNGIAQKTPAGGIVAVDISTPATSMEVKLMSDTINGLQTMLAAKFDAQSAFMQTIKSDMDMDMDM